MKGRWLARRPPRLPPRVPLGSHAPPHTRGSDGDYARGRPTFSARGVGAPVGPAARRYWAHGQRQTRAPPGP
eukprot:15440999-Alexandrium_andersonii.AAC.1